MTNDVDYTEWVKKSDYDKLKEKHEQLKKDISYIDTDNDLFYSGILMSLKNKISKKDWIEIQNRWSYLSKKLSEVQDE
jgi:hypothetical protein